MDHIELLKRHDDPQRWEYPEGFDYDRATKRFATFADDLSVALGHQLNTESGSHIQDASFHSQIYLPLNDEWRAVMRFSNFGDMVAISDDESVPAQSMKLILDLLTKHGYVYVPSSVLEESYPGTNPGVTGIRDWWIRYFDWV